jgi:hypothetical protein
VLKITKTETPTQETWISGLPLGERVFFRCHFHLVVERATMGVPAK